MRGISLNYTIYGDDHSMESNKVLYKECVFLSRFFLPIDSSYIQDNVENLHSLSKITHNQICKHGLAGIRDLDPATSSLRHSVSHVFYFRLDGKS